MLACNPVTELNNLCTRHALQLSYEFASKSNPGQTICLLNVSPKSSDLTQHFEGVGSSKKEAKRNASKRALDNLRETYGNDPDDVVTLQEAVVAACTAEKLRKDPVLRCYLYMAARLTNGWTPMSILLETKAMKSWMKKQRGLAADSAGDVRGQIREHLKSIASDGALCVSDDGLMLQLKEPLPFPDDIELHAYANPCEKTCWDAVLLPADIRKTPACVPLDSKRGLLDNVIKLLQIQVQHLSLVPIVRGRSATLPSLHKIKGESAVDITQTDIFREDGNRCVAEPQEIKPPTLWSSHSPNAAKNLRASWICGRPIFGDALLTLARPSRQRNEMPTAMTWRDYSLADFWHGVYAVTPHMLYISDLSLPLLGKIPARLESISGWRGQLPYQILNTYLNLTGRSLLESQKSEGNSCFRQELKIIGTGLAAIETEKDAEIARQRAALKLIHMVQAEDSVLWATGPECSFKAEHEDANVVILDAGHRQKPVAVEGSRAKVQYRLLAWSVALENWFLIEWSNGYILDVCNSSLLNGAVIGLYVNGSAKVEFTASFNNLIDHHPTQHFCLFVRVLSVVGFLNQVRLFDPPLSQQRYAAVAQQLTSHACPRVVDIGCGEGRFLESLISGQQTSCSHLYGLDVSSSALNRAASRMSQLEVRQDLVVELFSGNILNGSVTEWKKRIDAAVMIEVVEHLDPDPLNCIGETVLGVMRPRVFIVTTPNWEYNRLLYQMDGIPTTTTATGRDGTPLRCSDHRFEWTRAEFQAWAADLAEKFAYDVHFHGIGEMLLEADARMELGLVDSNLGQCSQMAVFTDRWPNAPSPESITEPPCRQLKTIWTTSSSII